MIYSLLFSARAQRSQQALDSGYRLGQEQLFRQSEKTLEKARLTPTRRSGSSWEIATAMSSISTLQQL